MNVHGRLVECGMISQYNAENSYGLKNMMQVIGKQLIMQGFIISTPMSNPEFMTRFATDVSKWIAEGKLKYVEHIVEGLDGAPEAFVGMLKGANTGKQIIKIA
ncbi:hypothetical protein BC833DRAFT_626790 [Globomyces pollinis-pini]|nr:hypothetical protein BC833DRAFT_626790 [Globomyces pollinis-pini]